jgi:hypothetical protein
MKRGGNVLRDKEMLKWGEKEGRESERVNGEGKE